MYNPIIEEVRKARAALAAEHGNDLQRIHEWAKAAHEAREKARRKSFSTRAHREHSPLEKPLPNPRIRFPVLNEPIPRTPRVIAGSGNEIRLPALNIRPKTRPTQPSPLPSPQRPTLRLLDARNETPETRAFSLLDPSLGYTYILK